MSYDMIDRYLRNNLHDDDYAEYSAALDAAIEFAVVEERERTSVYFSEVCEMAEQHAGQRAWYPCVQSSGVSYRFNP